MTDQDPTQPFEPPMPMPEPVPPAPPAGAVPPADPVPPAPTGESVAATPPPPPSVDLVPPPPSTGFAPPAAPVGPTAWSGSIAATGSPAPTEPVTVATAGRPGRSRLKWVVALVVTLLVATTAAGATLLLTGSSAESAVTGWVPADTVTYAELRLDLPGSQKSEFPKFMAAFPGFADQAAFSTKLDELTDQLIKAATNDKHDYRTEIGPWFDGQIAVAHGPLPKLSTTGTNPLDVRYLVLARVKDGDKAVSWLNGIATEAHLNATDDTYNGTRLRVVTSSDGGDASSAFKGAYGFVGNVLLVGDLTSVKAAIDTKGTGGLEAAANFKTALSSLPADRLGFMYTDTAASLAGMKDTMNGLDSSGMVSALWDTYTGLIPGWTAMSVRASGGTLVMDAVQPHVAAFGDPANHESGLAAVAPADTLMLLTGRDLGARLKVMRDAFAKQPAFADALKQVDQALGVAGGFDAATGWIGETGIAVTRHGETVDGGLLIVPNDRAAADRLLTELRSLATLSGLGGGTRITFNEEAYGGTTIVSVDLGNLNGLNSGSDMMPIPALPSDLKLAWAVTDEVVVIGVGTDFVKDVLDARGGHGLAAQPRYADQVDKAGKSNSGIVWIDIDGLRKVVEPLIPSAERSKYDSDAKPYLEPLDVLVGAGVAGKDVDRSTYILTVKP